MNEDEGPMIPCEDYVIVRTNDPEPRPGWETVQDALGVVSVHWKPALQAALSGDLGAKEIAEEIASEAVGELVSRWNAIAQAQGVTGTEKVRDYQRDSFRDALHPFPIMLGAIARAMIAAREAGGTYTYPGTEWADTTSELSSIYAFDIQAFRLAERLGKAGLSKAAAKKAAAQIRKTVLGELDAFPAPQEANDIRALLSGRALLPGETPGKNHEHVVRVTLARFISRRVTELIARAAPEKPPVKIPSEVTLPMLFTGGAPHSELSKEFSVLKGTDADERLISVTVEMKPAFVKGDTATLTLFENEELFSALEAKENLPPDRWRQEALAMLPRFLGPEALALYYWTWADCDDSGTFLVEPSDVLKALGMENGTRARNRIMEAIDELTRVELRIIRKYGPGAGLGEADYKGRLILPSTESVTLKDFEAARDGSRGPRKFQIYRHATPMVFIRRKFNVGIPREAFKLVGKYGYRTVALLTNCRVIARTFASKLGTQGSVTYRGPDGFEMPLEDALTRSGFVTPGRFKDHPGDEIFRARETVKQITGEGFFGKGSEVFAGKDGTPMFRFVSPPELKETLAGIAQERPLLIEEAKAEKRKRGRPRKPNP